MKRDFVNGKNASASVLRKNLVSQRHGSASGHAGIRVNTNANIKKLFATIDTLSKVQSGDNWRIVCGDCIAILKQLPDKSVDLIFADPPYNLQLKKQLFRPNMTRVDGVEDSWDKFESFAAYDDFCREWLSECRRVLTDNGAIWTIGTYHNIGRVSHLMQDLGFWLQNDVVWKKKNPMPNFRGVRFTNATETLIWAKKSEKSRAVFNHQTMKRENGGKQMTNVWEFPLCGGAERLRDSAGVKLHSTQKPEALLRRVILASSRAGDIVLDPFLGSGTTVAVARQLGRVGVGIDRETKYIHVAAKRVASVQPELLSEEDLTPPPRRVPFSELLKRGLVQPGAILQSKDGRTQAKVLQGGKIKLNGTSGSIHQMGAKAAKVPSCNGWNFWFVKDKNGKLVCVDEFRAQIRQEM